MKKLCLNFFFPVSNLFDFFLNILSIVMKNWAKKHILLSKIRVKRRKKDRSRPLKDKKGHFKFRLSFKGHIKKRTPQHHCIYSFK
jgi:hypothetical protein